MYNILVAGGGKIGATIAHILSRSQDYQITLIDSNLDYTYAHFADNKPENLELMELDIEAQSEFKEVVIRQNIKAVISCLPYFCNKTLAQHADKLSLHYFDLTEDRDTASFISGLAKDSQQCFVPQCGLAPGLIDILANDLVQKFAEVDSVKLRCGALPVNASNALQYSLTWSPDGLINEYGNPCNAIDNGQQVLLAPLENKEDIQIDGLNYEAFNTSGGIGSLAESYDGKVTTLNYKSIRYPGHCDKMRFLMKGLKLNNDRKTLKKILLNAIPYTTDDVVIVYVSVTGKQKNQFTKESFVNKYYPHLIDNIKYTAIQMTTACSACAVVDIIMRNSNQFQGRVLQEQFTLNDLTQSDFGQYLKVKQHDKHPSNITY